MHPDIQGRLCHDGTHIRQRLCAGTIGHSEIPARPGDVAVYTVAQSRDFISAKRIRLVTNILGNMIRGDGAALNIVAGGECYELRIPWAERFSPTTRLLIQEIIFQHGSITSDVSFWKINLNLTQLAFLLISFGLLYQKLYTHLIS